MGQGGASETVRDTSTTRADTVAFVQEFFGERRRPGPDPQAWDSDIDDFDPWDEAGFDRDFFA
jgi:hypothetical protein